MDAFIFFISFFTILTNLVLVLIYASALFKGRWLEGFRRDGVRAMMAGIMTLVMIFYHFMLANSWNPQGWFKVCDIALHYVTPIIYLAWWTGVQPHGSVRFRDIPAMFIPAAIYVAYVMIRGAITKIYPYAVFDAHTLGYGAVVVNIAGLIVFTGVLFAVVVLADRILGRRAPQMS
ncbi:Pr6Pr family membrane protein [Asticcacaulis machinosus]|uniref:Pr6Pr family membrane protein n=1 Tax=Asticcacaulis machinosus TaxID=2984211 RepID=A0ABT5HMV8_9CAUL|nr:Pr6Pr family membrane protein [Asticcacaulis machinosus]MDC7677579.1 Pr6Pr family membrane protein [Asticcacaulis machinosus]